MKLEEQVKISLKESNIDRQFIDLEFLLNELTQIKESIRKVERNDRFSKDEHIFSHIQIRRD